MAIVRIKTATLFRILAAAALAGATLAAVGHVDASGVRDGLTAPGAVLGMAGSVVGFYDMPSGAWTAVCMAGNFIFYTGLWWVLIGVLVRRSAAAQ
jgi:hypothetical protein